MPTPWNDDASFDAVRIRENARLAISDAVGHAGRRGVPSIGLAQEWHRILYRGCALPIDYYAGEVRDSDTRFPELVGYEVRVGRHLGVRSADVPSELVAFESSVRRVVSQLDAVIPAGRVPASVPELRSVVELAATVHGEWVHIHPFANGNGRTARLWANWVLVRYGLPPIVRIKPRPAGDAYAIAAGESVKGNHQAMVGVIHRLVQNRLQQP